VDGVVLMLKQIRARLPAEAVLAHWQIPRC
jgi:hypothetical protein